MIDEKLEGLIIAILIVGLAFLTMATVAMLLNKSGDSFNEYNANSSSQSFIATSSQTLTPIGEGITTSSASTYNQTWLEFDGVNDYVEKGSNQPISQIDVNNSFAISTWIKIREISTDGSILQNSINSGNRIGITIDGNYSEFGGYNGTWSKASGGEISKDIWVNLIATKINNNYKLYHNGILQTGNANQPTTGDFGELTIGKDSNNNYFNGSISDFEIINNTNFTIYQAKALYDSSKLGNNLGKIVPVLYFHHITDYEPSINTNTSDFIMLMNELNYSGYETITTENLIDAQDNLFNLPEKPIIIQFDDGWNDTLYIAKPIMDNYSYFGEVPVIVNKVGTSGYMTWNNLSYLYSNGWGIVAHTVTHAGNNMTNKSYEERQYEFSQSKLMIDGNLSTNVRSFIFPANQFNSTLLEECGVYYRACSANKTQYWASEYSYKNANLSYYGFPRIESYLMNENNTKQALRIYGDILDYKLNENTGTTAYDSSGNGNNGTISGATWNNDGILNTLTSAVDYTISSTGTFTLLNNDYLYDYVMTSWSFNSNSVVKSITEQGEEVIGDNTSIVGMILTISLIGVVLFILIKSFIKNRSRI